MKSRTLAALMVLTLAGGLVLAQPAQTQAAPAPAAKAQPPMGGTMPGTPEQGTQGKPGMQGMPSMMPDMTPEQMEKLDAIRTAELKEMLPLRTDLQVKQIELDALWRADEPNAQKIIAKTKEIGDIREKMEVARINHQFDVWKIMTPEQRKAMKKMGMCPGMGPGRGPGMMGPGMGRGRAKMMRGPMGGDPQGGCDCGGPQGPDVKEDGPQGCPDCEMH